jgi:hypothetical protein
MTIERHEHPTPGFGQAAARALVALALLGAGAAQEASALAVYNTGVADDGTKLAPGQDETHWLLAATNDVKPPPTVVVSNQHPSGQYYAVDDAMWIWANAAGSADVNLPYTYHLDFDLTGYDPSTAKLSGAWGVDNTGKITLNGAAPVGTGTFALNTVTTANFNTAYSFSITGGFSAGLNSLEVQVTDAGNPAAFNVRGLSIVATPVPEPATVALFGAGLLALFGLARRARRRG